MGEKELEGAGFAGFRIHTPLNTKSYYDEVVAFLGASYFRAVAAGQQYGLSARGLAIDTGLSSGEEFPKFEEFWIVKPAPEAENIVIFTLINSPSIANTYEFIMRPNKETIMDITINLWFHKEINKLNLTPLTNIFLYT